MKSSARAVVIGGGVGGTAILYWLTKLGWRDVAAAIARALEGAIGAGRVTYDLARLRPGATTVSTSAFGDAIIEHLT